MRLRSLPGLRGLRRQAETPHDVDAAIDVATRTGSIRIVPFQPYNLLWFIREKASTMRRVRAKVLSHVEDIPLMTQRNHDVRPRPAAGGYALSQVELDVKTPVHGGYAIPASIRLSESHPKKEN